MSTYFINEIPHLTSALSATRHSVSFIASSGRAQRYASQRTDGDMAVQTTNKKLQIANVT